MSQKLDPAAHPEFATNRNFSWRSHSHPRSSPGLLYPIPYHYSSTLDPHDRKKSSVVCGVLVTYDIPKRISRVFQTIKVGSGRKKKYRSVVPPLVFFSRLSKRGTLSLRLSRHYRAIRSFVKGFLDVAQHPCKLIDRALLCSPPTPFSFV